MCVVSVFVPAFVSVCVCVFVCRDCLDTGVVRGLAVATLRRVRMRVCVCMRDSALVPKHRKVCVLAGVNGVPVCVMVPLGRESVPMPIFRRVGVAVIRGVAAAMTTGPLVQRAGPVRAVSVPVSVHESVRAPVLVHVHLALAGLGGGSGARAAGQRVAVGQAELQGQVVAEALTQALVVVEQGGQAGGVVGLVARLGARGGGAQGAAVLPARTGLGGCRASWLAWQRMKG